MLQYNQNHMQYNHMQYNQNYMQYNQNYMQYNQQKLSGINQKILYYDSRYRNTYRNQMSLPKYNKFKKSYNTTVSTNNWNFGWDNDNLFDWKNSIK